MKKLLLSFVCVLAFTALSAQVSENFSDYTVGGKLAQQAQTMGRDYWTTWSNAPGGSEDGVIAEMPTGNNALFLNYGNDQLLKLGKKEVGIWNLSFKIYIPETKDAYFNVQSDFTGDQDGTWACEIYLARSSSSSAYTPGVGIIYAGSTTGTTFNFTHDTWIPVQFIIDLDSDNAEFYMNGDLIHTWTYSSGNDGSANIKVIDCLNIYPPIGPSTSSFYIDDIVFKDPTAKDPIMDVTPLTVSAEATEGATEPISTAITVSNTGEGDGTYTSKVVYGGDVEDWITLTGDANGTVAPAGTNTFNIVMDPTDLEHDTYNASILVGTNDVEHISFTIECTLVIAGVGVDNYTLIQTKLFPNPASGMVTIDCNNMINSLDIINYMGQVVYSSVVNATKTITDISQLSAGTYFVKINTEVGTQTSKLIVK